MIKAIPTVYKGYKFRSRLEARVAVYLDALNIKWEYEPEGFDIDGVWYLPDFYLPESKSFLEVKGVMCDKDMTKITKLIEAGYPVTVMYDDFSFETSIRSFERTENDEELIFYNLATKTGSGLYQCRRCGKKHFGGYYDKRFKEYPACPCCNWIEFDDDDFLERISNGNGYGYHECTCEVSRARLKARQARFEYGEVPGV